MRKLHNTAQVPQHSSQDSSLCDTCHNTLHSSSCTTLLKCHRVKSVVTQCNLQVHSSTSVAQDCSSATPLFKLHKTALQVTLHNECCTTRASYPIIPSKEPCIPFFPKKIEPYKPRFRQQSPMIPKKSPIFPPRAPYFRQRALYFRKRALCIRKSVVNGALCSTRRALDSPERALDSPERALDSPERALDSAERPLYSPAPTATIQVRVTLKIDV